MRRKAKAKIKPKPKAKPRLKPKPKPRNKRSQPMANPAPQPLVTPPSAPTDVFSPWPTLITGARLGVASDGSVWVSRNGAMTMVAAAGTIPHPMSLAAPEAAEAETKHGKRSKRDDD